MRIVTLNTWKNEGDYPRRLTLMRDGLADLAPDVVCLQECFASARDDTAAWLAAGLGLDCHAVPARAKVRRHMGQDIESTSGLAILARGGMSRSCALPNHPADGERIAQRLDCSPGERPLRILNLHLIHLSGPEFGALRAQQLVQALEWSSRDLAGGLIVAGDLNATAADPALAALDGPFELHAPTLLGPRAGARPPGRGAIDHLALQKPAGWRVASRFRALDRPNAEGWFPSDHAAVVVDLA